MAELGALLSTGGIDVTDIVIGMVTELGVVTAVPGYDFWILIQVVTRDEDLVSTHRVVIPSQGHSLAELRRQLISKHVLVLKDQHGKATHPVKGRCSWGERRNVFISTHTNQFQLDCTSRVAKEVLGVFNHSQYKKFLLPMPALGWRLAVLNFTSSDDKIFRFIFDGEKERSVIRPQTAPQRTSLLNRAQNRTLNRPKTASNRLSINTAPIPVYLRVHPKPVPAPPERKSKSHIRWQY